MFHSFVGWFRVFRVVVAVVVVDPGELGVWTETFDVERYRARVSQHHAPLHRIASLRQGQGLGFYVVDCCTATTPKPILAWETSSLGWKVAPLIGSSNSPNTVVICTELW